MSFFKASDDCESEAIDALNVSGERMPPEKKKPTAIFFEKFPTRKIDVTGLLFPTFPALEKFEYLSQYCIVFDGSGAQLTGTVFCVIKIR